MIALVAAIALAAGPDVGATRPASGPFRLGPKPSGPARRVVTLAPSLTEVVIALGAADRIVGVTRFDDAPEVKSVRRVGGFVDPSPEAVLAQRPDLVLAQPGPGNKEPVEIVAELGVPVLVVPLHSFSDVVRASREIGASLGLGSQGEELARSLVARRDAIRRRAAGLPRPKVMLVFGWEPLVVAGPGSFADELARDAGAANVVRDGGPFQTYDAERALGKRPEVIVDCADVAAPLRDSLLELPGFAESRVVKLSAHILRPGPRLADALEEMFRALHPGDARK